jgi:hypothetical protein
MSYVVVNYFKLFYHKLFLVILLYVIVDYFRLFYHRLLLDILS